MARLVSVILSANADPYVSELLKAEASNQRFEKSTQKSSAAIDAAFKSQGQTAQRANQRLIATLRAEETEMEKAAKAAQKYGKATAYLNSHKQQLSALSTGMAVFGAAAGAAFGLAVKAAADFDQSMSEVKAAQGGSAANMDALRKSAIEWGQKTKYSATEAADGITQLIKAGVSAKDVMSGGLQGALNLAAVGELSVGDAAEDAASAMNQFQLKGKDVPHIADLLAAAAGKAQGEVSDMAQALKYVGPVAGSMGVSIEQTTGAIAELASNGILADQAGTSLRGILASLTSPSQKAAGTMKELGINVYDAKGNFVGFNGIAGQLQKGLRGLSNAQQDAALGVLFGNQQVTAARILYSEGAAGINEWTKKVNDSGFAARSAATKMDNLKGDLEQLRGAFETALIGAGEGQQAPLRGLVQTLTDLVNKWNDLSDGTKNAVARIVGGMAAVLLAGAGLLKIASFAATAKAALIDLGISGKKAGADVAAGAEVGSAGMSKMGKAAGLAAAGFVALQIAGQIANSIQGDLNPALEETNTLLDLLAKKTPNAAKNVQQYFSFDPIGGSGAVKSIGDALTAMDRWDFKVGDVIDNLVGLQSPLDGAKARFDSLDDSLASMVQNGSMAQAQTAFAQLVKQAQAQGHSLDDLLPKFGTYRQALEDQAVTLGTNLSEQQYVDWMGGKVPDAIRKASTAAIANKHATDDQKSAAQQASPAAQELANANANLQSSYDDLNKATEDAIKNFTVLKQGFLDSSQASDEFQSALNDLSKDVADTASAQDSLRSANEKVADAERNLSKVRHNGKSTAADIRYAERQLTDARRDARKAQDNLTSAQQQNSKSLKGNTDAAIANRGKIRDVISAMNDKITADFKNEQSTKGTKKATDDAARSLRQQKQDLIDTADKAGYNRKEVKKMVDQMVLTPKQLRTQVNAYGIDDLRKQIKDLQAQIDKLTGTHHVGLDYKITAGGHAVNSKVIAVGGKGQGLYNAGAKATGGYISGPGGPTEDAIHARLSNGEYVIKASSVQKVGRARLDYLNTFGDVPKFREGGLVNTGGLNDGGNGAKGPDVVPNITLRGSIAEGAVKAVIGAIAATTDNINQAAANYFENIVESMYSTGLIGNGRFEKALNFARSQQGKPYVWAAAGPGGYDCSGFMGAIQNVIEGKNPYSRRWSTMAFQGQQHAEGFTKNASSAFQIGVTNAGVGHTAGTLNGVNVESRGGDGVLVGPRARGHNDSLFPMHYGLTAGMAGHRGIMGSGLNTEHVSGSPQQIARKLMLIAGYPASDWPMVDYIISHESGWDVHARNSYGGAYGLPQALPASKMASAGPDWRNSAATQMEWFFSYVKDRYGGLPQAYNFWRSHHYYSDGGSVSGPGTGTSDDIPAWLSNGEYVINAKSTAKHRQLLDMINADKYATGGVVGYGSSSKFDISAIVRLIQAISNPIHDLEKFTASVKSATKANQAAQRALTHPRSAMQHATHAYNVAVDQRNNLRLTNAKQTNQARAEVAHASDQVKKAQLALQKLAPENSKISHAQSALLSAERSLVSKRRSDSEAIAKIEDKIKNTKKGTVAYQNLITEKQLKQKSNARDIAAAEEKVAKARKAADKAGVNTGKITRAQQNLTKAENALTKARAHQSKVSRDNALQTAQASAKVTAAEKAKKRATDAYNKASDRAKAKADALKTAQQNLAQEQQAVADSALAVSNAFSDAYLSKSTAVNDWLQSMALGTKDIADLNAKIKRLRSLGLSETLIQQIIGMGQSEGAPAAETIASQIISGGTKMVDKLNKAGSSLQKAADQIGYAAATGKGRYATGGYIRGAGTGTSDSITARISNGEYVVNAAATARNRRVLDAINYGGHTYPRYASGGMVGGGGISKQELVSMVATLLDSRPVVGNINGDYDQFSRRLIADLNRQRAGKMHRSGVGVFR